MKETKEGEFEEGKVDIQDVNLKPQRKRVVIIETDGNTIELVKNECSLLELREIGRTLMNAQAK